MICSSEIQYTSRLGIHAAGPNRRHLHLSTLRSSRLRFPFSPPSWSRLLRTQVLRGRVAHPHLLLFVLATLRPGRLTGAIRPQNRTAGKENTARRYIIFFQLIIAACIALQAHSTYFLLQDLNTSSYAVVGQTLWKAIHEHPAVSSVSWDVIYCTVSAIAWIAVNGGSPIQMLGGV